jgi:RNase P subunit RPR2
MKYSKESVLDRKEDILVWIEENKSKSEMARLLGVKPGKITAALKEFGIEYSGNQGLRGIKIPTNYSTAENYIKTAQFVSSHKLRVKLLRDGIKEHRCEICNNVEWMGKKVPLELDHIDGNHFNNEFSNLRVLCPNCHAQTDTYAGKKNKRL